MEDITIICRECGKKFIFSKNEIEFYLEKGLKYPKRCQDCRKADIESDVPKNLKLKRNSFLDNVKTYGMPTDIRQEHPDDDIWHDFYGYKR